MWFANSTPDNMGIGRITMEGRMAIFPLPETSRHSRPTTMISGSDGNLWMTEFHHSIIDRITTNGEVTQFRLPNDTVGLPLSLAEAPDGALWVTARRRTPQGRIGSLGRMTKDGQVTDFTYPGAALHNIPAGITAGPDGNMWFTIANSVGPSRIGRITPEGNSTMFDIPVHDLHPGEITVGPDGNLWFTADRWPSGKIGRITTDGEITLFDVEASFPSDITAGPDGALWFSARGAIGRISTGGVATLYSTPWGTEANNHSIAFGPDGNAWFTAQVSFDQQGMLDVRGRIGRLLVASGGRTLRATLSGASEVPDAGDPDGSGAAALTVNPGLGEVCYEIGVEGIATATAAHIHQGTAGVAGPVVVALEPPRTGQVSNCVEVGFELARAILVRPMNYYVNIHNEGFRNGAIRGQLQSLRE